MSYSKYFLRNEIGMGFLIRDDITDHTKLQEGPLSTVNVKGPLLRLYRQ